MSALTHGEDERYNHRFSIKVDFVSGSKEPPTDEEIYKYLEEQGADSMEFEGTYDNFMEDYLED